MFKFFLLTLLGITQVINAGEQYAVLVAGSRYYYNYRHQADISHAYRLLTSRGFKKENIITMMYDDVVNDESNIYKGKLFNNPDLKIDFYEGINIDYTGDDVTPEMFLSVLRGNSSGVPEGKPVLRSTSEDNVFINFADHGGHLILGFPHDDADLDAKDLEDTLQYMSDKKMFKHLLLYVEACESGSMFDKILPKNENILAITAANPHESSYGCYFNNDLDTYLGDFFSVYWMEDSDASDLTKKSIYQQYRILKNETTKSHVMMYGQRNLQHMKLSEFMGPKNPTKKASSSISKNTEHTLVSSREVDLYTLTKGYQKHVNNAEKREEILEQIYQMLTKRKHVTRSFQLILEQFNAIHPTQLTYEDVMAVNDGTFVHYDCYKSLRVAYTQSCYSGNEIPQVFDNYRVLMNLCHFNYVETPRLVEIIESSCKTAKQQ